MMSLKVKKVLQIISNIVLLTLPLVFGITFLLFLLFPGAGTGSLLFPVFSIPPAILISLIIVMKLINKGESTTIGLAIRMSWGLALTLLFISWFFRSV